METVLPLNSILADFHGHNDRSVDITCKQTLIDSNNSVVLLLIDRERPFIGIYMWYILWVWRIYFINRFNKNAGQPNSNLTYYDGMINLTYSNGDSYSNGRLRKTQITFLCERDGKSYLIINWKTDYRQVHILKPNIALTISWIQKNSGLIHVFSSWPRSTRIRRGTGWHILLQMDDSAGLSWSTDGMPGLRRAAQYTVLICQGEKIVLN